MFSSYASDLVSGDTNAHTDVFLRDRQSGTTELVSVNSSEVQGDDESTGMEGVAVSYDGRFVAFTSNAQNLVSVPLTSVTNDLYVRDRVNGQTRRVAMDAFAVGANNMAKWPSLSDNGFVVFSTYADNVAVGDTNGAFDVYIGPIEPIGQ